MTPTPSRLQRLHLWQWKNHTRGYELVRIFIGAALLVRGILFLVNPDTLAEMAGERALGWVSTYVIAAHIAGGAMMTLGLFTRIGALIQIPILVDATFFVHLRGAFNGADQSLELAALTLVLLVVVYLFGPGRLSLDYRLFGAKDATVAG